MTSLKRHSQKKIQHTAGPNYKLKGSETLTISQVTDIIGHYANLRLALNSRNFEHFKPFICPPLLLHWVTLHSIHLWLCLHFVVLIHSYETTTEHWKKCVMVGQAKHPVSDGNYWHEVTNPSPKTWLASWINQCSHTHIDIHQCHFRCIIKYWNIIFTNLPASELFLFNR